MELCSRSRFIKFATRYYWMFKGRIIAVTIYSVHHLQPSSRIKRVLEDHAAEDNRATIYQVPLHFYT